MAAGFSKIKEKELLEQLSGDKAQADNAFKIIYRKYSPRIMAYCKRMLNNDKIAEDIFQETFIRFYQKAAGDRPNYSIAGFLITIARNLCFDHKRKKNNMVPFEDFHSVFADESEENREDKIKLVIMALDLLELKDKEPLILRLYEGFSYDEIAEIYSISPGNARKRVFRAKLKLKEILEPYYHEFEK